MGEDEAWEEFAKVKPRGEEVSYSIKDTFLAGFAAGQVAALTEAADAMDAQKPREGYVVVHPERVGGWLRDRARAVAVKDGGSDG